MPTATYHLRDNGRPLIPVKIESSDELHLAMLDTGSEKGGMIDTELAARLGLVALPGARGIRTASGVNYVTTYEATVRIPELGSRHVVELASINLTDVEFGIALGTDFLANFTILYEGRQKTLTLRND